MDITVSSRHVEVSAALRAAAIEKVGRLALEERKGMVAGHKIEFLVEDNKSDPKEAASAAEKGD